MTYTYCEKHGEAYDHSNKQCHLCTRDERESDMKWIIKRYMLWEEAMHDGALSVSTMYSDAQKLFKES